MCLQGRGGLKNWDIIIKENIAWLTEMARICLRDIIIEENIIVQL